MEYVNRVVSRRRWRVIAGLLLSLSLTHETLAKKQALLVGIESYPYVNPLHGPARDVESIQRLLIEDMAFPEENVKVLLDSEATREGFLGALESWLVEGTTAGDEIFFYYSGHGFQIKDRNGDEEDGQDEAIAPFDSKISNGEVINMISDDEMQSIFSRLADRQTTIVLDACHSGTLTRGLFGAAGDQSKQVAKTISRFRGDPNKSLSLDVGAEPFFPSATKAIDKSVINAHRKEKSFIEGSPNQSVWSAVSAWQKALVDFETNDGSVFTRLFVEGLRDNNADSNRDGHVSHAELLDFTRKGSASFCQRHEKVCFTGMTPTLETSKDLFLEDVFSGLPDSYGNGVTLAQTGDSIAVNHAQDNNVRSDQISTAGYTDQALFQLESSQVSIQMLQGSRYKVGEAMTLRVDSQVDGYLMLFDVNQAGDLIQLFPNRFSATSHLLGKIYKNQPILLPTPDYGFDFLASEPAGKGTIYAVVSEEKLPSHDNGLSKDLIVIDEPKQYVNKIAAALRQVWNEDMINRERKWTTGKIHYTIYN